MVSGGVVVALPSELSERVALALVLGGEFREVCRVAARGGGLSLSGWIRQAMVEKLERERAAGGGS